MYYVYVIKNETDEFYTGFSANLEKRVIDHNAGRNESTKGHQWKLVYYEAYVSEYYARERERVLKQNRRMKTLLLNRVKESLSY